jgi:hypothetical protein
MARSLALGAAALLAAGASWLVPGARADGFGPGQSIQEKQIYDYGPTQNKGVLGTSNPIELMNRIRRGQALDNATNPGDAVDQALKELEGKSGPPGPRTPGAAGVKGP